MRRVLVTGMSGTGKSSVVAELTARGYKAVDADDLSVYAPDGEWVWDEDRVDRLLSTEDAEILFLAGAASNQVRFMSRFDAVVLLSVPEAVLVERLRTRTSNDFGKSEDELAKVLDDLRWVEPLLRRVAALEVVTTCPLPEVVERILRFVDA